MAKVHPTAIVNPEAQLHDTVEIGPYAVIGPHVKIGEGSRVGAHAVIEGRTTIGKRNRIFQMSSVGAVPQDLKYAGEDTQLVIGDDNQIREFTTLHIGTSGGGGLTKIGNKNLFMANTHVAHDCQVGSHTIFANACQLAGHVTVGDWAIFGATTLVHQFVHIGAHAFTGMGTYLPQDLPPYIMAAGNMAKPYGINKEGLKRRGFSAEAIAGLKRAYKTLYRKGLGLEEATQELQEQARACAEVKPILEFLARSKRGIIR